MARSNPSTVLLLLAGLLPSIFSLTCQTYSGNELGFHSGVGTQSCGDWNTPWNCKQIIYFTPTSLDFSAPYTFMNYAMACDDEKFCVGLPDKACCTKQQSWPAPSGTKMVVKCDATNAFGETMDFNSFPDVCTTPCDQCVNEGDCDYTKSENTHPKGTDGRTIDGVDGGSNAFQLSAVACVVLLLTATLM